MTDLHCHILPGVDDGSGSLEESLEMVRLAIESGVDTVCSTPHFLCADEEECREFLRETEESFRALSDAAGERLKLVPGAEVLCTEATPDFIRQRLIPTLGGTKYMLTEFYFDEAPQAIDRMLGEVASFGLVPVIAHPERYDAVQRYPEMVSRWFAEGYVIQLNKGSVLGSFGGEVADMAEELLSRGLCHVVASDAHAADRRTTDMSLVREVLTENCGHEYTRVLLEENPSRILRGLDPVPPEE